MAGNIRSAFLVSLLTLLPVSLAADVGSLMRQGNRLFSKGKFDEALGFYQRAEVLEPDALSIHYNIGNTLYRLNRPQEAMAALALAATDKSPVRRANALYNAGNVQYRADNLSGAITAYRAALLSNPNDRQAKENLEFCLKKQQEQQQQQQNQQQDQQQGQQQQQQQPQPQPQSGMSKDQAEAMLRAIQQQEKQTQQEMRDQPPRQVEQDW